MGSLVRQKTKKGPVLGKVLKPNGDPWHALRTKYCALANTKGQQASCCLGSALPRGREAGVQQPEPESKGLLQSWPRDCIFHQTVGRLLVANHIFLGSWWFTSARSVTAWDQFPRGDTWQTWDCALGAHPGNQAARIRDVHKMQGPPGTVHLPSTRSPERLGPGKGTNTQPSYLGLCFCREPRSLRSLDLGSAQNAGPTQDSALAEHTGAWAVWTREAHATLGCGKPSAVHPLGAPHTRHWQLFVVSLPLHSTTEQVSLN